MTDRISVTVNGETHHVSAPPRTQLAEVLRDMLDLTGTHLGCEQGVCGACTVMLDGRPVRSCITFINGCDGAQIETIEGHRNDPVMDRLREAFSHHHALQCGFCTPGMLATGRDILARHADPDERTIRIELSGNLCRCTGYVGIVRAIQDVAAQADLDRGAPKTSPPRNAAAPATFTPFTPVEETPPETAPAEAKGSVRAEGNWTIVERSFVLDHAVDKVWALFSDVEKVASCVPGAALSDVTEDSFSGLVEVRFGPISARFKGRGTYEIDDTDRRGALTGRGEDKGGQSNLRGELHYTMAAESAQETRVDVIFRFQIEGMLAQFNRPELVTGFVDFILRRFIANCRTVLAGGTATASHRIGVFALGWSMMRGIFASVFRKK